MITLQARSRRCTRNCANCRYYRTRPRHPSDNNGADPYCEVLGDVLRPYISQLEWVVCANWDALQDPQAVAVYEELMLEWYSDTLKEGYYDS